MDIMVSAPTVALKVGRLAAYVTQSGYASDNNGSMLCENWSMAQFRGSFDPWPDRENRSWRDLMRRCFAEHVGR
jgi:hypothetical protein